MNIFFIPVNVPSSKNTRQIVHPKGKRARWNADKGFQGSVITAKDLPHLREKSKVIASKLVRDYQKRTEMLWISYAAGFRRLTAGLKKPLYVGFYLIRAKNNRFDYNNISQILTDLMVRFGWIDDDCADELVPVFLGYKVSAVDAGVIITILPENYKNFIEQYAKIN